MSKSAVKDLVFDLGGVLVDWDPVYLFRDHLGMPVADVKEFLEQICTPDWHGELDRGRTFEAGIRRLANRYPAQADTIAHWDSGWEKMFKGTKGDVDGLLASLSQRGYRLHALSNYPSEKLDFLYAKFDFMRRFHSVTISGLLGVAKPDPAIYTHVATTLRGRGCAFFDDRMENVDAAATAGFYAYHCPAGSALEPIVAGAIAELAA